MNDFKMTQYYIPQMKPNGRRVKAHRGPHCPYLSIETLIKGSWHFATEEEMKNVNFTRCPHCFK